MISKLKSVQLSLLLALLTLATACERDNEIPQVNTDDLSALPAQADGPAENATSNEKVALGRLLFWDPILSGNKDVACATCHHPNFGYADGRDLSSGVGGSGIGPSRRGGAVIKRNSPSVINTAFNGIDVNGNYDPNTAPMFWDNRANGLEEQAMGPILSHDEMCGDDIAETDIIDTVVARLKSITTYQNLFASAFGNGNINAERITMAIASFQRTLVSNNSRFDRYMRGDITAMNDQELRGMDIFNNAGCADCHSGPMFSDYELHTLSVPDHPQVDDDGATGQFDFRTPTLRNLNATGPYMHNGHFDQLRGVLTFYRDISGERSTSQNPNVTNGQIDQDARDLRLNENDIDQILTFLNTLNDDGFDRTIPASVPSGLTVGGAEI